ncbi:metallophosphatase family protein [Geomonas sp. Red32]|uniref:metallophosphoesterase family protein n=1 Tax=Geomonas sp. Red32 TaxID=2912856 RepID=UPI00202CAFD2|nr:metallophosphoesterase family protein [Geomonas sp. Red32]MCM0083008.1 metallophosphatase family protein [Geomonas sp. Red32]
MVKEFAAGGEEAAHLIGVISDTHGLLRPEAVEALRGVELIVHAGDIGKPEVVEQLQELAPVVAVRGNVDNGAWAEPFPFVQRVKIGEVSVLMIHNLKELPLRAPGESGRVIVYGHSHKAVNGDKDGALYLNPGSAGKRRFGLPVTVALLKIEGGKVAAEIVFIASEATKPSR